MSGHATDGDLILRQRHVYVTGGDPCPLSAVSNYSNAVSLFVSHWLPIASMRYRVISTAGMWHILLKV